mgnify:CR=1 FL=1|tara:strand:+ start:293 stop:1582 length:1290 start_codon:yes stop_codon:yes gene_type:complete
MDDKKGFQDYLLKKYGEEIVLKGTVSQTLNTFCIRGYDKMDRLGVSSSADVLDQERKPMGVQRPIKGKIQETYNYAMGFGQPEELGTKRVFTDVYFSARDNDVFSVKIGNEEIKPTQKKLEENLDKQATVIINISKFNEEMFQQVPNPELEVPINRLDGNHRLEGVMEVIRKNFEEGEDDDFPIEFPPIGFTYFTGLTIEEEDFIFIKINGENTSVSADLIKYKRVATYGDEMLLMSHQDAAQYIAQKLNDKGNAFEGLINMGGDTSSAAETLSRALPIKLSSFSSYIKDQIDTATVFTSQFIEDDGTKLEQTILKLWAIVKEVFPECFDDSSGVSGEYILFQATGLRAMANLLGDFMNELAVPGSETDWDNIKKRLELLKQKVSFSKDNKAYDNLTGLVGTKAILQYWREEIPKNDDPTIKLEELLEN